MQLKNKVAIVTGASSGIGKSIAQLFLREGAKVVFSDINKTNLKNHNFAFFKCDVSDPKQVKSLVGFCIKKFKKLDIMVNNAGIDASGSVIDTTDDIWNKVIAVNLSGVFYGVREAAKAIKKNKNGGSIINIASIAGLVGFEGTLAYCTSKGGVIQLTRAASIDLAKYKIKVNSIAPGVIKTKMTEPYLADKGFSQLVKNRTAVGYAGEPIDIANAALYLASDKSAYVTGEVLTVDGGWIIK